MKTQLLFILLFTTCLLPAQRNQISRARHESDITGTRKKFESLENNYANNGTMTVEISVKNTGKCEAKEVVLDKKAFAFWDETTDSWKVESGEFVIAAGNSSEHLPFSETVVL